jgi:hypothetical protein
MKYQIVDEVNDIDCGFDYESFRDGYWCRAKAIKVILDMEDTGPDRPFHFAHLCENHADKVLQDLIRLVL